MGIESLTREEEALLVEAAKNDAVAFGQLYELFVEKIYNYVYYRVGNHHDAEDLTAKVFFKALQHIGRYHERGVPFSAWLYRIARNMVANWHRDSRIKRMIALDQAATRTSMVGNPHQMAEKAESQSRLIQAIKGLPPDRQELIILKFVEHYSNRQIGEIMGRSEGAIKSLYHRTLLALREELDEMLESRRDQ